jgi:hypothetical protein
MITEYIKYLYNAIVNYWYKKSITNYHLPFPINIENDPEFIKFKDNEVVLNKIIFALNNIPDIVHTLLFNEKYFSITIKVNKYKITSVYHSLENIQEHLKSDNRYIYIRLNIITNSTYKMHHVNCIIIDKKEKYILFFEPRVNFLFNIDDLIKELDALINIKDYKKLLPSDIGYNIFNRLQKYDAFCQTYVLFAYILIINNKDIHYTNFSTMFNSMDTQSIGCLFYYINNLLENNNYNICDQPIIWKYPTNNLKNIFNMINIFSNNKSEDQDIELSDMDIYEEGDLIFVDAKMHI